MELNFNDLLKEIRRKKGISQASLASRTKLSQAFFVKIEKHNTIPNSENFVKILEGLQVSYDELKQLTIEYSKLVKPQQVEELICVEFAKSEYIISLLLDKMHFKSSFLDLYRKAYDGNKFILYHYFISRLIYLLNLIQGPFNTLISFDFYAIIDILKKHSSKILTLNITEFDNHQEKMVFLIKKSVKNIRELWTKNYKNKLNQIKSKNNIEYENFKQYITDEFIKKSKLKKDFNDNQIDWLKAILSTLIDNNKLVSNDLKLVYSEDTIPIHSFYKFDKDLILNLITINYDYTNYSILITYIIFNDEKVFIETEEGIYKKVEFKELVNKYTLTDLTSKGFTPFDNRMLFLKNELKTFVECYNVDINPLIEIITDFFKTINHIIKKRDNFIDIKLDNLIKENQALKQRLEELEKGKK